MLSRLKHQQWDSPIDYCIAQTVLENNLLLIHSDRDFETIAQVRSL
ncbi:hypothetical protein [Nostoc mirabile]|nr:hypothetical protein [Nostoc mirabile]